MRRLVRALAAGAAAGALSLGVAAVPAQAVSPAASYRLPQRWNDDYQPGTHCASPGARGTYVTAERVWFNQTDAASVANRNGESVPVTHKVTDKRTQTTEVSLTVTPQGGIEKYLSNAFGFNYVHEVHWSVGETVGPYELGPNEQGTLVWGFMVLDADAQDVRCSTDQEWVATGSPYSVSAPQARYSELRLADAPVFG
ncbi:hypothetical protein [uncultured Corynebacterium sp.]|uniref:hypothetical protein n=1 Tax=uncultured Corynebacterium sp. TaxID=159447 RepID=UPI0025E51645|nr:hypothetical protein [uncultured Corynebacterium sp.]